MKRKWFYTPKRTQRWQGLPMVFFFTPMLVFLTFIMHNEKPWIIGPITIFWLLVCAYIMKTKPVMYLILRYALRRKLSFRNIIPYFLLSNIIAQMIFALMCVSLPTFGLISWNAWLEKFIGGSIVTFITVNTGLLFTIVWSLPDKKTNNRNQRKVF